MFSIYRVFLHAFGRSSVRITKQNPEFRFNHRSLFSSAGTDPPKPGSKTENEESFTVNYLMRTWDFSLDKALSASKYLNLDSTEKADSLIAFLKNHGFSIEQIKDIVKRYPPVLTCDPQKTILPKFNFFRSLGILQSDIVVIFRGTPNIFKRSLEKQIIPSYDCIKSLLESNGKSVDSMKRLAEILCCNLQTKLLPNIEVLREAGVPDSKIVAFLQNQPRSLIVETEKFKKVVEEVKELRFKPWSLRFILAIHAFRSMNKMTWEKKVAHYKKWGWSEGDIILAFEKFPYCMTASTDKITAVMDFLVNKMGIESSIILKRPSVITFSLKNRIVPRCSVYKVLLEKGLVHKGRSLIAMLESTEEKFLQRFIQPYEGEFPGLLELYKKELPLSKS